MVLERNSKINIRGQYQGQYPYQNHPLRMIANMHALVTDTMKSGRGMRTMAVFREVAMEKLAPPGKKLKTSFD